MCNATLIISIKQTSDITKQIKSLGESGLFMKGVSKTIKNKVNEQKDGFLSMLLGILGGSSLVNLLTGTIRAGECEISTDQSCCLIL